MCFSAPTSFAATGILAALGARNLYVVKKENQRMFASIPFLFSLQQACEGFVWLSFSNSALADYRYLFAYGFLFFAFMLWPIWIPLAVRAVEKDQQRKRLMYWTLAAGISIALFLFGWLAYQGIVVSIDNHHILYKETLPFYVTTIGSILYLSATLAPFYLSSTKYFQLFGSCVAASYLISYVFYTQTLTSVWCFFAAILSLLVSIIITHD
jgi:Family of unknown function (DUF6629)